MINLSCLSAMFNFALYYLCSREFIFTSLSNKKNWIKTPNNKEPSDLKFLMNLLSSTLLIPLQTQWQ